MTTSEHVAPVLPVQGGFRWSTAAPIAVAAVTLGLLAWSGRSVLSPARQVNVAQAVFDRSAMGAAQPGDAAPKVGGPAKVVQAAGWLEAEPYYVACAALADGTVERMEVLEGDYVEAGQVVARLVAEDSEIRLRLAEAELAAAQAQLAAAEAELAAAETTWEEPIELERAVEAGRAALAESRAELAQLPSVIAAAEARLVRLEAERNQAILSHQRGAATELERTVAEQMAEAQSGEVEAIRGREPMLAARVVRLEAELRAAERALALRIEDRRRVDSARAAMAAGQAAVEQMQANCDEAGLELERMTIRAPISGFVQQRLKVPGDKVMLASDDPHSAHLVHLYDPNRLQVRVDVPLADAAHVRVGQRCEIVVEVLPDHVFSGTVLRTVHEADLQKNTLQAKVAVNDPLPILRPEMLARVKFLPEGESGGGADDSEASRVPVLVPQEALVEREGLTGLWQVVNRRGGQGELSFAAVESISAEEGWVRVTGPVQAGALLAMPEAGLEEGMRVRYGSQAEEASR